MSPDPRAPSAPSSPASAPSSPKIRGEESIGEESLEYLLISLDGKQSQSSPRGQKGAYPIKFIEFPDIGSKVNLVDDSTFSNPRYPLFRVLKQTDAGRGLASPVLVEELYNTLEGLRLKQDPLKVTLMKVVYQQKGGALNVGQYDLHTTVELDKATIHLVTGTNDTYQVQADAAVLGTGDKATNKVKINYLDKI